MLAQRPSQIRAFTRQDGVRLVLGIVVLVAVLAAILASNLIPDPVRVQVGQIAPADITAPRAIEIESQILTDQAREAARKDVQPQYDYTPENAAAVADEQGRALSARVASVDAAFAATELTPEERAILLDGAIDDLSVEAGTTLGELTADRWIAIRTESARVLDSLERAELRDSDVAATRARLPTLIVGDLNDAEATLAAEIVSPLIVPNSSFSEELTSAAQEQAAAAVDPVKVSLAQGEIIVGKGERVTAEDYEQIQALGLDQAEPDLARLAGWVAMALLLVIPLLAWFWRFRPTLWHRNNVLVLVGLIVAVTALALQLTAGRSILPYFLPTAAAGMLVAILLDAWAATVLMAILALLAGAVNGGSLELTMYTFLGGFAGVLTIRRGDRLNVFVQAGLAVALTNAFVVATFTLLGEHDMTGLLQLLAASFVSAGGAAVATVGLFAVLGNLFGILTVFQLLELANPSQALLRRLLVETPGTYHHSLMVGNLAERAAEAIGADSLLARVVAYYHDIGKLEDPLAFIENQAGGENIHDQLTPEVSAQVLKGHVAAGIDLAYKYRLPKTLIAFIPQHHGTALISYFYAKAREEAAAPYGGLETAEGRKAADAVDQARFRHAGPKPQTREAAILMLADGVEASVRSLASRDEAAIRAMVTRIIEERMNDGQFEECDLTLRDIDRIREAFVAQLLGMYHQRIAYPQSKIVEIESRRAAAGGEGGQRSS
jgi:putative nucleotidyltransferase with HDIG domain